MKTFKNNIKNRVRHRVTGAKHIAKEQKNKGFHAIKNMRSKLKENHPVLKKFVHKPEHMPEFIKDSKIAQHIRENQNGNY